MASRFLDLWALLLAVCGLSALVESVLILTLYEHRPPGLSSSAYLLFFMALSAVVAACVAVVVAGVETRVSARAAGAILAGAMALVYCILLVPVWGGIFGWRLVRTGGLDEKSLALLAVLVVIGLGVGFVTWILRALTVGASTRSRWWPTALVAALSVLAAFTVQDRAPESTPTVRSSSILASLDRASEPPETIVILTFDALRADHLSVYGYPRQTSPELDRILESSLVFDLAISPKTKTGPSLGSLMTGLYPIRHGALRHGWSLSPGVTTLPQRLDGYETAAFVANSVPRAWVETAGFDFAKLYKGARAARVLGDAARWLSSREPGKVLLWVHLIEPHTPYEPDEEDLALFVDDDWYEVSESIEYDLSAAASKLGMKGADKTDPDAVRAGINRMAARYDAYIRSTTRQAAAFLETVATSREHTLFIITSDHGESMVEHDFFFWHGQYCYQPVVRVPLAVYYPAGGLEGRSDYPASLVDIVPTLCSVAGCKGQALLDGVDLLAAADSSEERALYTSGLDHPSYSSWAVVRGGMKLILTPQRGWAVLDGLAERRADLLSRLLGSPSPRNAYRFRRFRTELFDLEEDPGELDNLAESRAGARRELTTHLLGWLDEQFELAATEGVVLDQEMSSETLEDLKALGYLD